MIRILRSRLRVLVINALNRGFIMYVYFHSALYLLAAVDVRVGSLADPKDVNGLAHFLEHMLFMGTEK